MNSDSLPGDYIAGFVDGEGCFALKYRKDRQRNKDGKVREYSYWTAEFAIVLHPSDASILNQMRETLGVGGVSFKKAGDQVRLSVQKTQELKEVIIPFFTRFPLRAIKLKDFELWSRAVEIIHNHQQGIKDGRSKPLASASHEELHKLKLLMTEHKTRYYPSGERAGT